MTLLSLEYKISIATRFFNDTMMKFLELKESIVKILHTESPT